MVFFLTKKSMMYILHTKQKTDLKLNI